MALVGKLNRTSPRVLACSLTDEQGDPVLPSGTVLSIKWSTRKKVLGAGVKDIQRFAARLRKTLPPRLDSLTMLSASNAPFGERRATVTKGPGSSTEQSSCLVIGSCDKDSKSPTRKNKGLQAQESEPAKYRRVKGLK